MCDSFNNQSASEQFCVANHVFAHKSILFRAAAANGAHISRSCADLYEECLSRECNIRLLIQCLNVCV